MFDKLISEARGWIADVWGNGYIHSLSDAGVVKVVNATYEGGWSQFERDAANLFV
jgi:hypothetical protein